VRTSARLDFFSSKLHLYYSSSQLTLLLTFLSTSQPQFLWTDSIPLPSRLEIIDEESLDLYATAGWYPDKYSWHIFQNFLNSDDPLALEERRYAVAALACLKILFGHSQLLVSRITWLTNTPALSGSIWKTIPDGNIKITRLQSTGDLDSTGTSGLTIAIRCYKNRVSGTDSSNSIGKVQFKIIAQTTFYSFYKILRTPTTFSTSLVIECSDLDTYIESIPHTSKRLFLPSRHTLNESRERRARSGLVSRFGGVRGGFLRNKLSSSSVPHSVHVCSIELWWAFGIILRLDYYSVAFEVRTGVEGYQGRLVCFWSLVGSKHHQKGDQHSFRCLSSRRHIAQLSFYSDPLVEWRNTASRIMYGPISCSG